ncbi:hypothetical protein [Streptacidiphilus sp. EB129]|uniref:hypothetical protein n=1 Tax=Streptacidiphilus sp. EB129 TaxID=3156262 RepID=UPI003513272D
MPTPHGSRGGMAFSADELRVLRRALAQVLHPASPASSLSSVPTPTLSALATFPLPGSRLPAAAVDDWVRAAWVEDVQDVLRLAESIDEAVHEAGRMRAFALADLTRYRQALPGSASGYLERLEDAVADGYLPAADDLSALRALTALPCAHGERSRRLRLRSRCAELAEAAVRRRLQPGPAAPAAAIPPPAPASDNVAEFARPSRLRDQSRAAAPAAGGHARPLPSRRGGPIPMAPFAATPGPEDSAPKGGSRDGDTPAPPEPPRPIPTPGDLWPRGVRRPHGEAQLATG